MVERHSRWPSNEQLAWTLRQRQVLDLIGRGRTNAEIADEFGISLAGAKWHVSEVLSKLGVASREEAAAYWREERGVKARLHRAARRAIVLAPLKVVAGTAALAAIAGGVILGIGLTGTTRDAASTTPAASTTVRGDGAVFTDAEALQRATYIAGLYLKQTDLPQTTQISGHPLQVSDLTLVSSGYSPPSADAATPVGAPDDGGIGSWAFEWERDGVTIPGPPDKDGVPHPAVAATDGIVTLNVKFQDGTGKVLGAGAAKSRPAGSQPPAPLPTPDTSLQEPATMTFPVATLGSGPDMRRLGIYRNRGGEWCWSETDWIGGSSSPTCPVAPSAEAQHIFGVVQAGALVVDARRLPVTIYGAVSTGVDHVQLVPEKGSALSVTLVRMPAETGLPYRAFFTEMGETTGSTVTIEAFAANGSVLERKTVTVHPSEFESTDGVVEPRTPISFSGTEPLKGGYFELPPPAFPVKIALSTAYAGDGPITVDLVCDTGTVRIIDQPGPDGDANGSLIVDVPPGATQCSFDVHADGWWSIRSK